LFLVEAALLHHRIRQDRFRLEELLRRKSDKDRGDTYSPEINRLEDWLRVAQRRERWSWRVGTSLSLVLLFCISSLCFAPSPPPDDNQITARILDQVEKVLGARKAHDGDSRSTGGSDSTFKDGSNSAEAKQGPIDVTLKLDPALKDLLQKNLESPPPSNSLRYWVVLIVILVVAAALIGWVLTKKPKGTPLAAALATLTATGAVIAKLVGDKPIKPLLHVPLLVVIVSAVLAGTGILLIGAGAWCLFKLVRGDFPVPAAAQNEDPIETGPLLGAALLVYGFCAVLMALVPPLLLRVDSVPAPDCPKCPTVNSVIPAKDFSVARLSAITRLGDGRPPTGKTVDPGKILPLETELHDNGREGDILLLLGSADCVPTRPRGLWKNNDDLASARADWVLNGLRGKLGGVRPKPSILPQYERCAKTEDMRAVYPFLIRAEDSQTGKQQ
jgi:hypothetical protein